MKSKVLNNINETEASGFHLRTLKPSKLSHIMTTNSYKVLNPSSLEVNPCNQSR